MQSNFCFPFFGIDYGPLDPTQGQEYPKYALTIEAKLKWIITKMPRQG